jgi:putative membrane protein
MAAVLIGLLAAPLGALRVRAGRRWQGAALGAALGAGAALALAASPPLLAAGVGAATAVLLPGSLRGWRHGTFDAAFGRSAFSGGRGEAVLPARLARGVPSGLVDPTARLQLERAVLEIEEKAAAELVVTVLRRCDRYDGARWRGAAWLALVAGAAAALVPGAPGALAWCGTLGGGVLGLLAGRLGFVQRALTPAAAIEEAVADAAWDAFAHAGLTRTPGRTGVLLFASLFERRVVVLGDEGIDRHREPAESWQEAADAVSLGAEREGLAAGLEAGIRTCGALVKRHAPERSVPAAGHPPPIRIQD